VGVQPQRSDAGRRSFGWGRLGRFLGRRFDNRTVDRRPARYHDRAFALGATPPLPGARPEALEATREPAAAIGASRPGDEDPRPSPAGTGAGAEGARGEVSSTAAARDRAVHRRLVASAKAARGSAATASGRGGSPSVSKAEAIPTSSAPQTRNGSPRPGAATAPETSPAAGDERAAPPTALAGVTAAPQARGPKEIVAEGEKLLAQGEVAEACRRGEDAKHAAGKLPTVYKFLGKCYMRAGNASLAKDNYRHYLELAPNAPDALFIESIVKESAK